MYVATPSKSSPKALPQDSPKTNRSQVAKPSKRQPAQPVNKRNTQLGAISTKRAFSEPAKQDFRDAFRRDRDRIIHSTAFRRLEYKTQVFINHESDHFRNRLTHSLEVSQIARSLTNALGGSEPLAEALALAHDLGHPPFGHEGEDALKRLHSFDHNHHTLKLVTELEDPYPYCEGLNLTLATLEGLIKHSYPELEEFKAKGGIKRLKIDWDSPPSLEAFSAAIADDIAYNCHDLDDGIRGNFFAIDQAAEAIGLVGEVWGNIKASYPQQEPKRLLISTLIGELMRDLITGIAKRIASGEWVGFLKSLRGKNSHLKAFSPHIQEQMEVLRGFLHHNLYKNPILQELGECGGEIVQDLFTHYKNQLPAQEACDYVAGMTDRFAITKHKKFFPAKEHLRKPLTIKL